MKWTVDAGRPWHLVRNLDFEVMQAMSAGPSAINQREMWMFEPLFNAKCAPCFIKRDAEVLVNRDGLRNSLSWLKSNDVAPDTPFDDFHLVFFGALTTCLANLAIWFQREKRDRRESRALAILGRFNHRQGVTQSPLRSHQNRRPVQPLQPFQMLINRLRFVLCVGKDGVIEMQCAFHRQQVHRRGLNTGTERQDVMFQLHFPSS